MVLALKSPNIALIKYMGKDSVSGNLPSNSSLSYPMSYLNTAVELTQIPQASSDEWQPLIKEGFFPLELSEPGKKKFLSHFSFLKKELNIDGCFLIRSANNFPSDCGLASSASSFAALTEAAFIVSDKKVSREMLPLLSQRGSGSSCRSFSNTWCLWEGSSVLDVKLPQKNLLHGVVILEEGKKAVSSSEAHSRIKSSDNNVGRSSRANLRLKKLLQSFQNDNWKEAFEITWAEFWDMHVLFETSQPPFSYMTERSLKFLRLVQEFWTQNSDGPLVTMDAGANVHLLWREDQLVIAKQTMGLWAREFKILMDPKLKGST